MGHLTCDITEYDIHKDIITTNIISSYTCLPQENYLHSFPLNDMYANELLSLLFDIDLKDIQKIKKLYCKNEEDTFEYYMKVFNGETNPPYSLNLPLCLYKSVLSPCLKYGNYICGGKRSSIKCFVIWKFIESLALMIDVQLSHNIFWDKPINMKSCCLVPIDWKLAITSGNSSSLLSPSEPDMSNMDSIIVLGSCPHCLNCSNQVGKSIYPPKWKAGLPYYVIYQSSYGLDNSSFPNVHPPQWVVYKTIMDSSYLSIETVKPFVSSLYHNMHFFSHDIRSDECHHIRFAGGNSSLKPITLDNNIRIKVSDATAIVIQDFVASIRHLCLCSPSIFYVNGVPRHDVRYLDQPFSNFSHLIYFIFSAMMVLESIPTLSNLAVSALVNLAGGYDRFTVGFIASHILLISGMILQSTKLGIAYFRNYLKLISLPPSFPSSKFIKHIHVNEDWQDRLDLGHSIEADLIDIDDDSDDLPSTYISRILLNANSYGF